MTITRGDDATSSSPMIQKWPLILDLIEEHKLNVNSPGLVQFVEPANSRHMRPTRLSSLVCLFHATFRASPAHFSTHFSTRFSHDWH